MHCVLSSKCASNYHMKKYFDSKPDHSASNSKRRKKQLIILIKQKSHDKQKEKYRIRHYPFAGTGHYISLLPNYINHTGYNSFGDNLAGPGNIYPIYLVLVPIGRSVWLSCYTLHSFPFVFCHTSLM